MGYTSPHDPDGKIAANTRKFVLSTQNKFYHECIVRDRDGDEEEERQRDKKAEELEERGLSGLFLASDHKIRGIGSPHTPDGYIWHMSLIMQGNDRERRLKQTQTQTQTDSSLSAMTTKDPYEVEDMIDMLVTCVCLIIFLSRKTKKKKSTLSDSILLATECGRRRRLHARGIPSKLSIFVHKVCLKSLKREGGNVRTQKHCPTHRPTRRD